ncbi:MAG TPA: IPT/TIG domain-containing protein, partial [Candidatus Acidoferrales bacterium]|nr:IPT/TIG domain-containing protein [Candidatus Acidoferrales bacterium]
TVGGQTSATSAADQFTYTTAGDITITFDDLANPNRPLSGSYGGINWGSGNWYLSSPWGRFTTNSISFPSGPTSATFSFLSPQVLTRIDVYNGGTVASTITLSCTGDPTVSRSVAVGQVLTITTGWSATCSTVTVGSSNGWDTNFDNLTYGSGGAPPPSPTVSAVSPTSGPATGGTAVTITGTGEIKY